MALLCFDFFSKHKIIFNFFSQRASSTEERIVDQSCQPTTVEQSIGLLTSRGKTRSDQSSSADRICLWGSGIGSCCFVYFNYNLQCIVKKLKPLYHSSCTHLPLPSSIYPFKAKNSLLAFFLNLKPNPYHLYSYPFLLSHKGIQTPTPIMFLTPSPCHTHTHMAKSKSPNTDS